MSNIVKNARTALLIMNERGLAPTPHNYAKIYYEVSGEEQPNTLVLSGNGETSMQDMDIEMQNAQEIIKNNRMLVEYLGELTASVTTNTGDLTDKLQQQHEGILKFMVDIQASGDKMHVAELLQPILTLMDAARSSVKASHTELESTREALNGVSTELTETKQQMLIDPLTGARNRQNMELNIDRELTRAKRLRAKVSVAMLDIDHFKNINDGHGHDVGDTVLAHFSDIALKSIRETDTLFRYGGEEFLLLMPQTDRETAVKTIAQLHKRIAATPPENSEQGNQTIPVTFSAGVAELTKDDEMQTLVKRADAALYQAKKRGRNRTVTDSQIDGEGVIADSAMETKADSTQAPVSVDKPVAVPAEEDEVEIDQPPISIELLYLGSLPIVLPDQSLNGYSLSLYASKQGTSSKMNLGDMARVLNDIGADRVLSDHFGFIPVAMKDLMSNQIAALTGANRMVLELGDVSNLSDRNISRLIEIKARGFKLGLNDYFQAPVNDSLLRMIDFAKIDVQTVSKLEAIKALRRLRSTNHTVAIAKNVESPRMFETCRALEFGLMEGFFFAHPEAAARGNANPDQAALLVVMGQLLTDVELPRIEHTFHGRTELVTNLLALVNSAGMGLARTVDSLQQALVILGRRQLMRWVQVLLYKHSDLKSAKVLMHMATVRAKLMDGICAIHPDADKRHEAYRDRAFSVGILSLTDVLLGINLEEVLDQIGLEDDVRQALMTHQGFLGDLLVLAEKMEHSKFEEAEVMLKKIGTSGRDLNRTQRETLRWVHDLGRSSDQ
jgi:EAL and modified HD-GYP domain-containing signal transduction protein